MLPELYSAVKAALPGWQVRGWPGVSQMHQARNVAQHAGVAQDAGQLPNWADATIAFIDSMCLAAFGTGLGEIMLAAAVRDASLRTQLRWSEEQVSENPGRSFSLALGAFDEARNRWRAQRDSPVFAPSPGGDPPAPDLTAPQQDVDDFLEVQPFAGDPSQYTWLRRARQEHERAGWLPNADEARRALLFVTGWIVRWEIFDLGYPVDRWDAHREAIEPTVHGRRHAAGDHRHAGRVPARRTGTPCPQRDLCRVGQRPGSRSIALGHRPTGRAHGVALVMPAAVQCSPRSSGTCQGCSCFTSRLTPTRRRSPVSLSVQVTLAAERHAAQLAESAERERDREQLETALRALIASARSDELALFGEASVVNDQWLGTFGWLAFLQIRVGNRGQEELTQTHNIFGNHRTSFPNLHVHEGQVAFSVSELTEELADALRTAIADSEEQARHVRAVRAQQTRAFQAFAAGFQRRFGPLPES